MSIKISEDEYQQGLNHSKNNLHGWLILPIGSQPLKLDDLRSKLMKLWKPLGPWKMVPLGKGYYEFSFASPEDLRGVWVVGAWNVQLGLLRLSQWTPDFHVSQQKQTHVQVWIHILDLPQEYWRPKLLFEIAGGVGTPTSLDDSTRNRIFGHFACILVDVDLTNWLPHELLVERDVYAFFVGVEYERLPFFCSHCQVIGHSISNCNKNSHPEAKKMQQVTRQHYTPKQKPESVATRLNETTNPVDDTQPNRASPAANESRETQSATHENNNHIPFDARLSEDDE